MRPSIDPDLLDEFEQNGHALLPGVAPVADVDRLRTELAGVEMAGRGGARNLLDHPAVHRWLIAPVVRTIVERALGPRSRPVRAILFDKTPDANWRVTWHQDVTIAVRERIDTPGYGPWSRKADVWHVQPPTEVLEQMLALRLHLDPCGREQGPVRVVPGSHRAGKLRESEYRRWRDRAGETTCLAEAGDVLLMRPLLLHASSPATVPSRRRVLHVEYASTDLPAGLVWHWAGRGTQVAV